MGDQITAQPANNGIEGAIQMPPGSGVTSIDESGTAKNIQGKPVGQVDTNAASDQSAQPAPLAPPPGFSPAPEAAAPLAPPPGFTAAPEEGSHPLPEGSHVGDYQSPAYHRAHPNEKAPVINPAEAGQPAPGEGIDYRHPITPLPGETTDDTIRRAVEAAKSVTPEQIGEEHQHDLKTWPVVVAATGNVVPYVRYRIASELKQAVFGGDEQIIGHPENMMSPQAQKDHPYIAAGLEFAGGLTTPENIAMGAGLGKGVNIAERMVHAGFGAMMLSDMSSRLADFKDLMEGNGKYADMSVDDRESLAKHTIFTAGMDAVFTLLSGESVLTGKNTPATKAGAIADEAVAKTAAAVGTKVDQTKKAAQQVAVDKIRQVLGTTNDYNTAFMRMAPGGGGKARAQFRQQVEAVSEDLQAISNANPDKMDTPGHAADAIQEHLNQQNDALVNAASGARDTAQPVVPDSMKRLDAALDAFFDGNKGRYGTPEEVEAAKQKVRDRWMQEKNANEPGDPLERREPNLWEAENARRGLNDKTKGPIGMPDSANEAAARVGAEEARRQIDESFAANGVDNVAETRSSQAKLIEIINRLRNAEEGAKVAGKPGILKNLFKTVGSTTGIVALILGAHPVTAGALALGVLGEHMSQNIKNPNLNAERAQELAARNPNARAQAVEPSIPAPSTAAPPPVSAAEGVPVRPFDPDLHAQLASRVGGNLDHTDGEQLQEEFLNDLRNKKMRAAAEGKKYVPTDDERDLLLAINKSKGKAKQQAYDQAVKQAEENRVAAEKVLADKKKANDKADADAKAKVKEAEAQKEKDQQNILANENVAHSATMKSTEPAMEIGGVEGRTSAQIHGHENGHIMANVAEGLNPINFISEHHPDAKFRPDGTPLNAAAAVQTDVSDAGEGLEGIEKRVVGILGGPAFDEVHGNLPLNRNTGARGDISRAREILRDEAGLSGKELDTVFDALYDRAKGHVSHPNAMAIVQANIGLREAGLHSNYHMSPLRLEEYVNKLRGVYGNGETSTTPGVREGNADGGVSEGKPDNAGGEGKEPNGRAEKVPAKEAREANEGAAGKANDGERTEGVEQSNMARVPESAKKRRWEATVTEGGETKEATIDAFSHKAAMKELQAKFPNASEWSLEDGKDIPAEGGYQVPTGKHLTTPVNGPGEAGHAQTMRHELGHYLVGHNEGFESRGIYRHTHPEMQRGAVASVDWDAHDFFEPHREAIKKDKLQSVVRMIMGGAAADEAFSGVPRNQNHNLDPKLPNSDGQKSLFFLKQAGFTPEQATEIMNHEFNLAKEHLTKPEVAGIIQENADVREKGLSNQYHFSPERLKAMGDEAARRLNGKQEEGSDNGGVGGRGNEDRTGNVGAGEGGTATGNPPKVGTNEVRIPPERSTGNPESDAAIKAGGGIPGASMGDLAMFHSPQTGSTLALKHADVTPKRVAAHIEASDKLFKPEQKNPKVEQSNAVKSAPEVLQTLKEQHGVSDDAKGVREGASFITPEGQFIHLKGGVQHPEAIEKAGGGPATGEGDTRPEFLNNSGAIRTRFREGRNGEALSVSTPNKPVTPEQVGALKRAVGQGLSRYGNLTMERSDITPENADRYSASKEFPTAGHVDEMLRKMGVHPDQKVEQSNAVKSDVAKAADEYNREQGRAPISGERIPHSPEVAKRIADAYDQMQHNPNDPKVKAAYDAAKGDIDKQWDYATQKMGVKFEPWDKEGQPYANSKEMVNDVNQNKHLSFFRGGDLPPDHPMMQVDPKTGFTYNEKMRAVHDLFGHAAHENQFGPKGEENAWNDHRQMFSKEALPAVTTETRGQNSWVNFGKHLRDAEGNIPGKGEPGYVPPTERPYAENKAGILPEQFHRIDPLDIDLEKHPAGGVNPETGSMESKRYGVEISPEDREVLEHKPTAEDFHRYADEHQDILKQHPDLKIGWDTLGGKPELNIGISTDSLDAAKNVGQKLDQRAIWDTQKGEEIPTGGANTKREFPDYPFAARLADIEQSNASKTKAVPYPENEEGLQHISPKLLDLMKDTPDEKEFIRGKKAKQVNIQKAYDAIEPTMDETKAAIIAGSPLGGWWQRFIDSFEALGEPTEAAKLSKLGPSQVEALKAWHSAVSGNKSVEDANRTAWGTYADWLDQGKPRDRESIDKIVAKNGKKIEGNLEDTRGKGNAAISDTHDEKGNVTSKGLDTTKLHSLINSPQMREVNPEPFHGGIFDPNNPSPVAGVSDGARKIPSMAATVAGKGNLNRLVLDAHMLDFYNKKGWTDNSYIAHSLHLREAARELGLTGGEAQEQIWGTVLGIKRLLQEGTPVNEIPSALNNDVVKSIGKDYADIIRDEPELNAIFERLKKHGIDPGGERAQSRLSEITANKRPTQEAGANQDLLANVAERIRKQLKNLPEPDDTSFNFGSNVTPKAKGVAEGFGGKRTVKKTGGTNALDLIEAMKNTPKAK